MGRQSKVGSTRQCVGMHGCGKFKPLSEFSSARHITRPRREEGHTYICRSCARVRAKTPEYLAWNRARKQQLRRCHQGTLKCISTCPCNGDRKRCQEMFGEAATVKTKLCSGCKKQKPVDEFSPAKAGHRSLCKTCAANARRPYALTRTQWLRWCNRNDPARRKNALKCLHRDPAACRARFEAAMRKQAKALTSTHPRARAKKLPPTALVVRAQRARARPVDWASGPDRPKRRAATYESTSGWPDEDAARPVLTAMGIMRLRFQTHRSGVGLDFTGYWKGRKVAGDVKNLNHPHLSRLQIQVAKQMGRNYIVLYFQDGQPVGYERDPVNTKEWEPTGEMRPIPGTYPIQPIGRLR